MEAACVRSVAKGVVSRLPRASALFLMLSAGSCAEETDRPLGAVPEIILGGEAADTFLSGGGRVFC